MSIARKKPPLGNKKTLPKGGKKPVRLIAGEPKHRNGVTYQPELVRCNKPDCAKLHGPYWYAYWRDGSRLRKRYVGKVFRYLKPAEVR